MHSFTAFLTRHRLILLGLIILGAAAGGMKYFTSVHADAAPVASPAPTAVAVKTLSLQKVRLWTEFSGRLHAVDSAQIKPEVSGRITEVRFTDGQEVKAGDILFVIDPRPYEAAVERAEASVATAQSKSALAKIQLDRANALIATHAIAQSDLDTVDDAQRVAAATEMTAEAELKQAKLDLEHAYVTAPISGRVSRAEITVGNVVQDGPAAPVLTSIVSNDGIYADFEVDEQTYLQSIRNAAKGNQQEEQIPVELCVQGDHDHVYKGFIQCFDNQLDVTSGTIRARAKFANEDGALVPGMFVSVKLADSQDSPVLLVPERAISFDQDKKFVYVVGADSKVTYREVILGKQLLSDRVVESGLQEGDRVIVDGIQRVRPNDLVTAQEQPASGDLMASTRDRHVMP